MTGETYARLHPGALAVAGGTTALVAALFSGFGMSGFGSMMSGGGWMMGGRGWMTGAGYGHMGVGGGLTILIAIVVMGLGAGWIVASVYNAVVGRSEAISASGRTPVLRSEDPQPRP